MKSIDSHKTPVSRRSGWTWFWREWAKPLLIILLVTGALRSALADWNSVPTGSMVPTILEGDRIFVNKLAYDLKVPFTTWHLAEWAQPKRGDVVVFFSPRDGTRLVKRVIGLPGDTVAMQDNHLSVNGEPVAYEPMNTTPWSAYLSGPAPTRLFLGEHLGAVQHPVMLLPNMTSRSSFAPMAIPQGHFFMMGDSRDNSFDSRYFGCVERQRIVGRASAVVTSLDPSRYYRPRWRRFFTPLL